MELETLSTRSHSNAFDFFAINKETRSHFELTMRLHYTKTDFHRLVASLERGVSEFLMIKSTASARYNFTFQDHEERKDKKE